jgi:hypothetical protein
MINKMRLINIFFLFLMVVVVGCYPQKLQAQTVIFEDNFEDNLNKWQSAYGTFEEWQIIDQAAYIFIYYYFRRHEITPIINWNYDWQHYQISVDYIAYQGADKNINLGFTQDNEWYGIHFVNHEYHVSHIVDGKQVWVESGYYYFQKGIWYQFDVELNHGAIKIKINDQLIVDVTDPTYNGKFGKPTLAATTGSIAPTAVSFDNYQITLLDDEPEEFEFFKQTNPDWSQLEYDNAELWDSDPSIGRWGCALASLAMILQHHGITKMPNNQDLDLQTLNEWLNSQPDG